MIKIHYFIWAGMCVVSFCIGVYIPAQRDYIASKAITSFLAEQPLHVLTNIRIDSIPDSRDL